MDIVNLNTYDIRGGAARAAYRLHQGIQKTENNSIMFVRYKESNDHTVVAFQRSKNILLKAKRFIRRNIIQCSIKSYSKNASERSELFTDERTSDGSDIVKKLPLCHVANLHWVRNFVEVPRFLDVMNIPIVWTLHDMNAFTGGCHYNISCERYIENCGKCPQIGSNQKKDASFFIWKRKRLSYQRNRTKLQIVAPSRWIANEAMKSSLLNGFNIKIIPYGIDTSIFKPQDNGIKSSMGLKPTDRVILFVADATLNPRKGFSFLQTVIGELKDKDVYVVSVGDQTPIIKNFQNHIHLGIISNDNRLSSIYSMADIFIIPSQQDNLPNTVIESLSCGTPVIGFNIGGLPEMVIPEYTGKLAEKENAYSLKEVLEDLLHNENKLKYLRNNCRSFALKNFQLELQAKKYLSLYRELFEDFEKGCGIRR